MSNCLIEISEESAMIALRELENSDLSDREQTAEQELREALRIQTVS